MLLLLLLLLPKVVPPRGTSVFLLLLLGTLKPLLPKVLKVAGGGLAGLALLANAPLVRVLVKLPPKFKEGATALLSVAAPVVDS